MNKAFYISGIVLSFIFLFVIGYYAGEVSSARFNALFSNYDYGSYGYGYNESYSDLTVTAGIWSLLFILIFIAIDLLGLIKIKTKTTKVLSIIGLSLSAIFLLWTFAVIASPGSMSFDEVAGGFGFYAMVMMAFSIVGLVQSIRFANKDLRKVKEDLNSGSTDLLDS